MANINKYVVTLAVPHTGQGECCIELQPPPTINQDKCRGSSLQFVRGVVIAALVELSTALREIKQCLAPTLC